MPLALPVRPVVSSCKVTLIGLNHLGHVLRGLDSRLISVCVVVPGARDALVGAYIKNSFVLVSGARFPWPLLLVSYQEVIKSAARPWAFSASTL